MEKKLEDHKENLKLTLQEIGISKTVINKVLDLTNDELTAIELALSIQEEENKKNTWPKPYENPSNQVVPLFPSQNLKPKRYKMVIVVRTDLKMGKGKIAAQVGHGVLGSFLDCMKMYPQNLDYYNENSRPKIVLKIEGEENLINIYREARNAKLPCNLVVDAGRTQIAPGSKTVCAIGPGFLISGF